MFERGSVWNAIVKMSVPAVITMIVMIVYNMADLFFVGKTGDELQIAAISLASPVYLLQMAVGTMIGGGGCAAISNALGQKAHVKVKQLCAACLILTLVCSILIGGVLLLFPDVILRALGANTDTWQYTKEYMSVLAVGIVFILFSNIFANVIRAEGAAKESMIGNGIGTILNIILDPIFILKWNMGVQGAAIATVIGNMAASLYYVFYLRRSDSGLGLWLRPAFQEPAAFGTVMMLGIPNAVSNLLNSMSGMFTNHILIGYGTASIVAVNVGGKANMIVAMIVMGICIGVQPLMAYNYGAKNKARIKEIVKKVAAASLVVGIVLTVSCYWFRNKLAGLFLSDEAILEQSVHIMEIQMITTSFLGWYYLGINYLQAAGRGAAAAFLSVFRQGLFYIPILFLVHAAAGLEGVYWVSVICDLAAVLMAVWFLRKNTQER